MKVFTPKPDYKDLDDVNEATYQIELQFNDKAELVHVDSSKEMTLALVNNHLAVAGLFLARRLVEIEEADG